MAFGGGLRGVGALAVDVTAGGGQFLSGAAHDGAGLFLDPVGPQVVFASGFVRLDHHCPSGSMYPPTASPKAAAKAPDIPQAAQGAPVAAQVRAKTTEAPDRAMEAL